MADEDDVPTPSQILFPGEDSEAKEGPGDLISQDLQDIDNEIGMQEDELPIADDSATEQHTAQAGIIQVDFFEEKAEIIGDEKFGEIEGMTAVAEDEEEELAVSASQEKKAVAASASETAALSRRISSKASAVSSSASESSGAAKRSSMRASTASDLTANRPSVTMSVASEMSGLGRRTSRLASGISVDNNFMIGDIDIRRRSSFSEQSDIPSRVSRVTVATDEGEAFKDGPISYTNVRFSHTADTTDDEIYHSEEDMSSADQLARGSRQGDEKRATLLTLPRQSIHYELMSRIGSADNEIEQFFDLGKQDQFLFLDEYAEAAEEESEPSTVEEEEVLDREPYYEKYMRISDEIIVNRIKNNFLQKLVAMYLKRRKVEHYTRDGEPLVDELIKYGQKLDAYEEFMQINKTQRDSVSVEVNALKEKKEQKSEELQNLFKSMQTRECHIGFGLIYAKTGNEIPNKLVERFIRRQSTLIDQVCSMRLKYIKLKGMVQEKLDAIERVDIIENGLRLADFEQTKAENRSYADKIEEREEELTRLRFKCQNTIQILAHMREKSSALDTDVVDLTDDFSNVEGLAKNYRAELANLKQSRDKYRQMGRKLKDESGLLTHPDLLIDMEQSQEEIKLGTIALAKYKAETITKTDIVRKLRKNMETLAETASRRRATRFKSKKTSQDAFKRSKTTLVEDDEPTLYVGRPTLYMPTIKPQAFNDLVKIRPTPKVSTRKKW